MKITPLWEFVIVERKKLKSSSIIIEEDAARRHAEQGKGVVQAVGDKAEDFIKELVGKEIVFKQHAGNWMEIDGEDIFPLHQDDILAVIER